MDKLEKYVINHSSCGMPRCEYVENGTDIDCDDCRRIMLAQHDAKVIDDFLNEALKLEIYKQVFVDDLRMVAEQMKEQKNE